MPGLPARDDARRRSDHTIHYNKWKQLRSAFNSAKRPFRRPALARTYPEGIEGRKLSIMYNEIGAVVFSCLIAIFFSYGVWELAVAYRTTAVKTWSEQAAVGTGGVLVGALF